MNIDHKQSHNTQRLLVKGFYEDIYSSEGDEGWEDNKNLSNDVYRESEIEDMRPIRCPTKSMSLS